MEDQNKQPTTPVSTQPENATSEQSQTPQQTVQSTVFTPVGQLFKDSWHLMTRKLLKLVLLAVYSIIAWLALIILFVVIMVVSGLGAAAGGGVESLVTNSAFLTTAGLSLVVYIILAIILNLALHAAVVVVIAEPNEETSTFTLLKRSFPYVVPLFIVGIIEGLIITGSFFLLIIPAIFVSIVLAFSTFTVILDKKQGLAALKMSVGIIQQHFGAIVGRFALFVLAYMGILIVLGMLSSTSQEIEALLSIVQMILSIGIGWFVSAYAYLIYKQARASYDETKPVNMAWIWIVSGLGWVIGIFATIAILNAIGTYSGQFMEAILREAGKSGGSEMMYDSKYNYDADAQLEGDYEMSPEMQQMFGEDFQKQLQLEIEKQQQMEQNPASEI